MEIIVTCPDIVQAAQIFANAIKDLQFRASSASAGDPATVDGLADAARTVLHQSAAPATSKQAPAAPVPAPAYTLDELSLAGGQLIDLGKIAELRNTLAAKFGVGALTDVPSARYAEVAGEFRRMGAEI